jgi:hypothetical protein
MRSGPRTKTLKGVGQENAGAEQTQKCRNCLEHREKSLGPGHDQTTWRSAQSKGFGGGIEDRAGLMIWRNSFAGEGDRGTGGRRAKNGLARSPLPKAAFPPPKI